MTIAVRSTDFMSGDGALSAFERNMADDMTRLGTLRRSADDGYVVAARGEAPSVERRLAGRGTFRGRAHGDSVLVEFASFSEMVDATLGCDVRPVPEDAFLDFSDVAWGSIRPDPEQEMALHAVFSALGQVVLNRPLPGEETPVRTMAAAAAGPGPAANPVTAPVEAEAPAPAAADTPEQELRRNISGALPFLAEMLAKARIPSAG